MNNINGSGRFPPWSRIQSIEEMVEEAGIEFQEFVKGMERNESPEQMARRFNVSEGTIKSLQEHFLKYGVSSVMGGD
ncbi:MAG: helix-turn-helix domain-containing protein [Syntrophomonadaceae bacterium]|jgi:hypothetical protein